MPRRHGSREELDSLFSVSPWLVFSPKNQLNSYLVI